MQEIEKSISFDGRDIQLKAGLLAPQAGGSVLSAVGRNCCFGNCYPLRGREGIDFLPLLVDYEERLYAAGRIPGGFLRREGRPPERATLISRLIDRPLRPLFPQWLRDDIQIVATTLSMDEQVPPDVLAATGASVAVLLAEIPFNGPMAAVRVGLVGDDFIINPTYKEMENGDLDLVVAGSPDGVIMVEAGANQLPEADVIEAIDFGYEVVQDLIQAQLDLIQRAGIEIVKEEPSQKLTRRWKNTLAQTTDPLRTLLKQFELSKPERDEKLDAIKAELVEKIAALDDEDPIKVAVADNSKALGNTYKAVTKKLMRQQILDEKGASRWPQAGRGASDYLSGQVAASPGPWYRPVPAGVNPGAVGSHPGDPRRCPDDG
jgi:polyribonucleotide nucleotidyltransferase